MQLEGKIALVTGGTKGIGAATAVELTRRGADVAINGRHDDEEAQATKKQIESFGRRAAIVVADVGKPDEATRCVTETVERLGPIDVLVHSAGGAIRGGILDVSPEDWHEAFDVHVHAVFHLVRAAAPAMQAKKEGAIILVSSVAGIRGLPALMPYQVVKGAIPQFTRALARELANDNVRVNAVAPGIIATRFHAGLAPEQRQHNLDHRIPLHREGTTEQVAQMIVELAANDYMTGETVVIDGGLTMRIA
ncbi:MAG: SDR family oxidoreductase [Pirellulales bacterium]|nr:SDR family oxidoreductase [Pirellulales bacterium]